MVVVRDLETGEHLASQGRTGGALSNRVLRASRFLGDAYNLYRAGRVTYEFLRNAQADYENSLRPSKNTAAKKRSLSEAKMPGAKRSRSQPKKKNVAGQANKRDARTNVIKNKGKRAKRAKKSGRDLKTRVKALEINAPKQAVRKVRDRELSQLTWVLQECAYGGFNFWNPTVKESYLTDLLTIDRTTGNVKGTLDHKNLGNKVDLKYYNIFFRSSIRNNNKIPCNVTVYWFKSVDSQSSDPVTLCGSFDAIVGQGGNFETNPQLYFSDMTDLSKSWKMIKSTKYRLNTGDEAVETYTIDHDSHDPEYNDVDTSLYKNGSIRCVVRGEGIITHDDTSTSRCTIGDGSVDMCFERKYAIRYPSDSPFVDIKTSFTNTGAVTTPVAFGPSVNEVKDEL